MPFDILKNIQYLNLSNDSETSRYLQSIHYTDKIIGQTDEPEHLNETQDISNIIIRGYFFNNYGENVNVLSNVVK